MQQPYLHFWLLIDGNYKEEIDRIESFADLENVDKEERRILESTHLRRSLKVKLGGSASANQDDEIYEYISPRLIASGYDNFSFVKLLGTFFLVKFYLIIMVIILKVIQLMERIVHFITGWSWEKPHEWYRSIKKSLIWNGAIRIILESYLEVAVCMMII